MILAQLAQGGGKIIGEDLDYGEKLSPLYKTYQGFNNDSSSN